MKEPIPDVGTKSEIRGASMFISTDGEESKPVLLSVNCAFADKARRVRTSMRVMRLMTRS